MFDTYDRKKTISNVLPLNTSLAFIALVLVIFCDLKSWGRLLKFSEANHRYNISNDYYKVKSNGHFSKISEVEIEILNESGRDEFGLYRVNYAPHLGELKIIEAATINGTERTKVQSSMIEDKALASHLTGFDDFHQIKISFPNVQVGSKIYVKIKYESKKLVLENFFSQTEFFGWYENALKQNLFIESEMNLFTDVNDPEKVLEIEEKKENGKHFINVYLKKPVFFRPVEEKDPILPRHLVPHIEIATEKDWNFKTFEPLVTQYEGILSEEIPEKFKQIILKAKDLKSFKEQTNFLMQEIQNEIRYFGDWRTINGAMIPRHLQQIADSGFGDCKDFSILLTFFLRQLGYKAFPAWVYRAYPHIYYPIKLPNLHAFNHAITYAEYENASYWFDATNKMVYTEAPLKDISERSSLVLKNDSEILKFIPPNKVENNEAKVKVEYQDIKKPIVKNSVQLSFKGIPASDWAGDELSNSVETIQNRLLALATFSPKNTTNKHFKPFNLKSRITENYLFEFSFDEKKTFNQTNTGKSFTFWRNSTIAEISEELDTRSTDLFLGYPRMIEYKHQFKQVSAKNIKSLNCKFSSQWVDFQRNVSQNKKIISSTDLITVKKSYISTKDFNSEEIKKLVSEIDGCVLNKALVFNP